MLKVGLLSPFPPEKDGIAIYSDNIMRGLGKKSKYILKIGRKGSNADFTLSFKSFSLKNALKRIIKKEKLSLLHIQYVPTLFGKYNLNYNLIGALNLSIPSIVTLHEAHYSTNGLRDKILSHIEKQIVKKADIIIVHTPIQANFLRKKYKSKNIICIYHGLRLNQIHKRIDNNILCFGMISTQKGVKYLIRAMRYLPHCNLTIAGKFVDKKAEKEVKKALKESKVKIKTDFNWINEDKKAEYYKNADLVVLPHTWAPYQSGILHNSISYGIPVVVTKVGALWEMADKFKFGEIVPPKSPKAIAEAIKKVFNNYKKYKKGILNYRKVANWPRIAEEHLRLYRKISMSTVKK